MQDIDNITNAWARWRAAQYGTTFWFTESTQYSRNRDIIQYMQHQTNLTPPKDLIYSSSQQSDGGAAILGSYTVRNKTSMPMEHTVTLQQGMEDTFAWSVTESLKVGVSVKLQAGVPFANAETSLSTELSLSSTQGSTIKRSSNYTGSVKVNIAPRTRGWGSVNLSFVNTNTSWIGNVEMKGRVAIWFNQKVDVNNNGNYHHLYFFPIERVFSDCINHNIISTQGYVVHSDRVIAQARGSFNSSRGLDVDILANEEPIENKDEPGHRPAEPFYGNLIALAAEDLKD